MAAICGNTCPYEPIGTARQPRRRDSALRRLPRRDRAVVEQRGLGHGSRDSGRDVRGHGPRRDRGLPPPSDPPLLRGAQAARVRVRDPRLDGGPGTGDELGRRSPQAPRPRRRGGRPPQPTRRARRWRIGRAARPVACAHRLAVLDAGPGERTPVRQGPLRGPRHARDQPPLPVPGAAQPSHSRAGGVGHHRHPDGRGHRLPLGRTRPHLPRPPHHLERQLRVPLPRHPPLRDRRPLDERGLAVAAFVRRVLAPQPPRLPPLGGPRAAALGDSPGSVRAGDHRPREDGSGPQRGSHRSRAPGAARARRGALAGAGTGRALARAAPCFVEDVGGPPPRGTC